MPDVTKGHDQNDRFEQELLRYCPTSKLTLVIDYRKMSNAWCSKYPSPNSPISWQQMCNPIHSLLPSVHGGVCECASWKGRRGYSLWFWKIIMLWWVQLRCLKKRIALLRPLISKTQQLVWGTAIHGLSKVHVICIFLTCIQLLTSISKELSSLSEHGRQFWFIQRAGSTSIKKYHLYSG